MKAKINSDIRHNRDKRNKRRPQLSKRETETIDDVEERERERGEFQEKFQHMLRTGFNINQVRRSKYRDFSKNKFEIQNKSEK